MRPLAIDDLVRDVMSLARAEAASKDVSLSFVPVPGLPPASGDRVHVVNATDAVQACPVADRRVVIEARADTAHVEMAVCDSGPGIPAADLGRIFEPLFSTKSGGLGMGLAICRTIVDAHGGRLWVEHSPRASGRPSASCSRVPGSARTETPRRSDARQLELASACLEPLCVSRSVKESTSANNRSLAVSG